MVIPLPDIFATGLSNGLAAAAALICFVGGIALLGTILSNDDLRLAASKVILTGLALSVPVAIVITIYQLITQSATAPLLDQVTITIFINNGARLLAVVVALVGLFLIVRGSSYLVAPIANVIYRVARRQYLRGIIRQYKTGPVAIVWPRQLVDLKDVYSPNLFITGLPGIGKSTLLGQIAVSLATRAIKKASDVIPVILDLNIVIETRRQLPHRQDRTLKPHKGGSLFVNRMLKQEAYAGRICFIIDATAPLSARSHIEIINKRLSDFLTDFHECDFVLAMPLGITEKLPFSIAVRFMHKVTLEPLSHQQIRLFLNTVHADLAEKIYADLLHSSMWLNFGSIPFVLAMLARFYASKQNLPSDLSALFRWIHYPIESSQIAVYEALLSRTAILTQVRRQAAVPIRELRLASQNVSSGLSFRRSLDQLKRAAVIKTSFDFGRRESFLRFNHPTMLAYFLALAWRDGVLTQFTDDDIADLDKDPVMYEAFLFFNNLESDPARLTNLLSLIVNRNDPFSLMLAAKGILAQPVEFRAPALYDQTADLLVRNIAFANDAQAQRFWSMLEHWASTDRLESYQRVVPAIEPVKRTQVLSRIGDYAVADLHLMLRNGNDSIGRMASKTLCDRDASQALNLFLDIYRSGPDTKRALALESIGELPPSLEVEDALHESLKIEASPLLRMIILESMAKSRIESTLTMLDVVSNPSEVDQVRACAARLLCRSGSPELENRRVVYDVVRTLRGQLLVDIRQPLQELLDHLRTRRPDVVEQCEVAVNPYIVGKPIADRNMFFGRDKFINELKGVIVAGNNVLLYGERRIGKTSILLRLARELSTETDLNLPLVVAYIDLQGVQESEFYPKVIEDIVKKMGVNEYTVLWPARPEQYSHRQFNRDLGTLIDYLKEKQGNNVRLVLLFDEVDVVTTYSPEMPSLLRRTFGSEYHHNLAVVMAGVNPITEWARPESPFYNLFSWYPVPPLEPESARALVTVPVGGACTYDFSAIDLILDYSGCKPYEIQNICQKVINHILQEGRRHIAADDVKQVYEYQYVLRGDVLHQVEANVFDVLNWTENNPTASVLEIQKRVDQTVANIQQIIRGKVIQLQQSSTR